MPSETNNEMHPTEVNPYPLVWIDCEMTGLDCNKDRIIEIACFITNKALKLLDLNGFETAVSCEQSLLDGMDEWCTTTHTNSGLIERVKIAPSSADVENKLLAYLRRFLPRRKGLLAGNTVHQDLAFLRVQFPRVCELLHYRILDVSTIKEIGLRINPSLMGKQVRKKNNHTAKSDILESIQELQFYYDHFFIRR